MTMLDELNLKDALDQPVDSDRDDEIVESEFCADNGVVGFFIPSISETEETSDVLGIMLVGLAAGGLKAYKPKHRLEIQHNFFAKRGKLEVKFPVWVRTAANWILREGSLSNSPLITSRRGRLRRSEFPEASAGELDLEETAKNIQRVFESNMSKAPELHLPESLGKIFKLAVKTFRLSSVERDVFRLALGLKFAYGSFETLEENFPRVDPLMLMTFISRVVGHSEEKIAGSVGPNGSLRRIGILETNHYFRQEHLTDFLSFTSSFQKKLSSQLWRKRPLLRPLTPCPATELHMNDFSSLKPQLDLVLDILHSAVREKRKGINILFHGAPGTGKTQATAVLAKTLGVQLYAVEGSDEGSDEALNARERLASYFQAQRILSKSGCGIILFDEVEDVLDPNPEHHRRGLSESKAHTNSLLESNPVPTVWITNSTNGLDEAWGRRFSEIVEFSPLPASVREKIIVRMLLRTKNKLSITPQLRSRLAAVPEISIGQIATSINTLDSSLVIGTNSCIDEKLEQLLDGSLRVTMGKNPLTLMEHYQDYDPTLLNTGKKDLAFVVESLKRDPSARLLLSGPSGTGKTGFAHYAAKQLGKPLLVKTASDILSEYVGRTEQAIARMFREATDANAVLLIDEVDSLMRTRSEANQAWEVSQVNELLTRMWTYNGILICTTNHVDQLDPAAIRRFLIRAEFNYLSPEQAMVLLEKSLGQETLSKSDRMKAADAFAAMNQLTPADFANVSRKMKFLSDTHDCEMFIGELRQECAYKKDAKERPVGFANQMDEGE